MPALTPEQIEKIVEVRKNGGSYREAARAAGCAPSTVGQYCPDSKLDVDDSLVADDAFAGILSALRKNKLTLEEIATRGGVSKECASAWIAFQQAKGVNLCLFDGCYSVEDVPPPSSGSVFEFVSEKDNSFHFGACGDQHLCSKYARIDCLNDIYDKYADAGITRVFNTGNWIDGEARFNKFDLLVHGMGRQLQYLADNYPQRAGITTWAVSGDDHEGWYGQREGLDIGKYAEYSMQEAGRTDWRHLGFIEAHIRLVNANTGKSSHMTVMHPGGGCFDETAEIMTRDRGWIPFSALTLDDDVATMAKGSHEFQWQRPTAITNEHYEGPMYEFSNRVFQCTVTPNHRFLVRRYNTHRASLQEKEHPQKARHHYSPDWYVMTAEEIVETYHRQRYQFPTACLDWVGVATPTVAVPFREPKKYASTEIKHFGEISIKDAAELIGWYATEGCASADDKQVVIAQCKEANPENHARILALLERLGITPSISGRNQKNIAISSVELAEWLVAECGRGSRNMRIPDWLKNQPKSTLIHLLQVMLAGDGWKNRRSFGYKTISHRLADDVCEIAQKCGYGVGTHTSGEEITVNVRAVQNTPTLNNQPTVKAYSGRIYCCTVPNGLIYVRCNGKAFWSHNSAYAVSYQPQKIIESLDGGEKPAVMLLGHYHKLSVNNIRNVWTAQTGCCQDQNPFQKKNRIDAHVGALIVKMHQDPETGAITRFMPEMIRYFNKGYYGNKRWSYDGDVELPVRM